MYGGGCLFYVLFFNTGKKKSSKIEGRFLHFYDNLCGENLFHVFQIFFTKQSNNLVFST